jgi:hypothetical protein
MAGKDVKARQAATQLFNFVGFTILMGLGGGVALVLGKRKLAGLLWTMLGAGSVGAAFDAATRGELKFNKLQPLDNQQWGFLAAHLPFLCLGLMLWAGVGESQCRRSSSRES